MKTGYRPSPAHKLGLGALQGLTLTAGPRPDEIVLALPEALDQLHEDCIGNSGAVGICHAMAVALGTPNGPWPELASRDFLYALLRIRSGDSLLDDSGGFIHALVEAVMDSGFPRESQWGPYGSSKDGKPLLETWPYWEAFRDATDQRLVRGAKRITSRGAQRVDDVLTAIASGSVVQWGTRIDDAIFDVKANEVWPGVTTDQPKGHAMLNHAYRTIRRTGKREVGSRSSWTKDYSDNGTVWVSEDAIASPFAADFWVWETLPNFSGNA